jgi:tetratricopeptide (TPR) repeat protein
MLRYTPFMHLPEREGVMNKRMLHVRLPIIFALVVLTSAPLLSQEGEFRASGDIAIALFSSGRYSEALEHFEILGEQYPDDPLYKYYYGRTLLELDRDPADAASLLEGALRGSRGLRPVPDDARFWLARAYHRAGIFDRAIDNYDLFSADARRKVVRELKVDEFSDLASRGQGAAENVRRADPQESKQVNVQNEQVQALAEDKTAVKVADKVTEKETVREKATEDKEVQEEILPDRITPADPAYDNLARQALELQFRADSVNRLADRYRERLRTLAGVDRVTVEEKILSLERQGFGYQGRADSLFNLLTERIAGKGERGNIERAVTDVDRERPLSESAKQEEKRVAGISESDRVVKEDSRWVAGHRSDSAGIGVSAGDSAGAVRSAGNAKPSGNSRPSAPVLQLFSTDSNEQGEIPVNPDMPAGLVYRVQIAAFRNPIAPSFFKNFAPVYGFRAEGSDITFYYIGMFRKKSDADKAVAQIRSGGFSDAFVVPVNNGSRVSLERAAALEKEWGGRSLVDEAADLPEGQVKQDSAEPSTLVYRVEAARVSRELRGDDAEAVRRVAGNRGLDIIIAPDGSVVYLIGKFLTFESASGYADLIYRNGIAGAKVVAYLGDREIPLERAREIFELYNK